MQGFALGLEARKQNRNISIYLSIYGLEVLGVPIGTDDFVQAKTLEVVTSWQNQLLRLRKLRGCREVQYQMLRSCANTRPGFLLRCVFPRLMEEAAEAHDQMIQEAVGDMIYAD